MAEWVTVFTGNPPEAHLVSGLLRSEGIPTYLPDESTKVVDPFITGANPLLWRVQAPSTDAVRVHEILDAYESRAQAQTEELDTQNVELQAEEALEEAARHDLDRSGSLLLILVIALPLLGALAYALGIF